jgi:hypothetical protein
MFGGAVAVLERRRNWRRSISNGCFFVVNAGDTSGSAIRELF